MHASDPAVEHYGIDVSRRGHGDASFVTASMTVGPEMVNSHGVCHGGLLFLLADAVMDYTTNGPLPDDQVAFAAHAEIDYVRAAMVDDDLTATGERVGQWGRTGLVDVTITNQRNETVAHFRGRTRTVPKR